MTESGLELRILLPTLPKVLGFWVGQHVLLQSQRFLSTRCLSCAPALISCSDSHLGVLFMALRLWPCDPHCLGHRCEAPSATGLAPSKTKASLQVLPPAWLCVVLWSPCPRDYNGLESSSMQAAGGPPELSHRPGNCALLRPS